MNDPRPSRRLAAILAADVAGYSRMMGVDETGTLGALKSCMTETVTPVIATFGGRIFKTTGDGFLAEFASAIEALDCAVKMQRTLAERTGKPRTEPLLQFRVGINLGDVIADGDDLFGDGVNVAARLEGIAQAGGICVSDAVYRQVVGKVGVSFVNMGTRTLKNIATPVHVFSVDLDSATEMGPAFTPPTDDRPSIAVLPFENPSADQSLELLADALVEDVIALLARVSGFFVVARSSSFMYRNQTLDVRRIGHELGVRYVVQGSVRSLPPYARISVQLVEVDAGRQLWSHRFDVDPGHTSELQDDIAHAIVAELEPQLTRAELKVIQRQRPDNLDTWSRFRRARAAITEKGWNEESAAESIEELRSTIRFDPNFAPAYANFALLAAFGMNMSMVPDTPELRAEAKTAAERAIALDPNSTEVVGLAGCAIADLGEDVRGGRYLERAIEIDPSNAQARVALGTSQGRLKRYDLAIENLALGIQRSPKDGRLGFWEMLFADILLKSGRLEDAIARANDASRRDAGLYSSRVVAAVALAKLGRLEEARAALAEARRIRPRMTLKEVDKFFGGHYSDPLKSLWSDA
jgi:adenylate cyclase